MDIKDRTILITGGTSGIGKALALALYKTNQVIVTGRSPERLNEMRSLGITAIACDLTQKEDLERILLTLEQEHSELDVLINNAGIQYNYNFTKQTQAFQKIQQEIQTNLIGVIQLTSSLIPLLSTKSSTIINVTSGLGAVPKTDGLIYSCSKAGLRNFHRGLRKSLKGQSIEVIELIPPVTATAMTAEREEAKMTVEELVSIALGQWKAGKSLLAPRKIRLLLLIDRFLPALADRIIR